MSSINIKTEKFKSNLYDLVNNSELPISIVYYIFKYVEQDLENTYYGVLNSEAEEHIETSNPDMIPDPEQMPEAITSKEDINEDGTKEL